MNPNQQPQQTREQFIQGLFNLEEKDNYLLGKEGITKIANGVAKGVEVIAETYGSGGFNADLEHQYIPGYMITNDGKQILDAIKLADKYENLGLNKLKEITEQNRTEQNRTEQNRTEQNRTEQKRTEQNRTEENRTEQNRTEQNRTEHKHDPNTLHNTQHIP